MGEGEVIQGIAGGVQGIAGGVLAIAGILIALSGSGLLGQRISWRVGLGLALSGVGLFMLITSFPQYAIGFSVLATLALAFAAFLTIKEADAREQRHRNNELLKEKRDKDERLLHEIIEWATDVAKCSLEKGIFDESVPVSGLQAEQALPELLDSVIGFRIARASSVYISSIASKIDPELKKSLGNLIEEIKAQIKLIMEYKRKLTPTWPADKVVIKIASNNERIYNLATTVIDDAANILKRGLSAR